MAGLIPSLVVREIRSRYRTSVLDIVWAIINPAVTLVAYGMIMTQAFGAKAACGPYVTFAWSGLVLWTFFATSLTAGVSAIVSSAPLVTKIYFPREALPVAAVGSASVDLGIGLVTVLLLIYLGGDRLTISSTAAVLPIFVLVCWSSALAILLSALAVFVRDTVHLVHLVVRVGIFVTPVFYSADTLPPGLRWIEIINPAAVAIEAFRASALCGSPSHSSLLIIHSLAGLVLVGGSIMLMRRLEPRIADLV